MAGSFIQELKRRNVFRVALVYVVVSWLLMQIGDVMFPALLLPEWTPTPTFRKSSQSRRTPVAKSIS
jgi:hypothetical protein